MHFGSLCRNRVIIVTNNPQVELLADDIGIEELSVIPVYETVRDLVHKGHRLLTHPLAGSLKPNENPYRSVVLTKKTGSTDMESVQLAEGSLAVARRMLSERPYRQLPGAVLADFRLVDHSLLLSALDAIREIV